MRGARVVMIAVLTAVAACSSPPPAPPPPPPAPPRSALGTWVDEFCELGGALSSALFAEHPVRTPSPTEADRRGVVDDLNRISTVFTRAREVSASLDPAPTAAANDLLIRYRQQLDEAASKATTSAKVVAQSPLADLGTLSNLVSFVVRGFDTKTKSTVTAAKKADLAMEDAFVTARGCSRYQR